jgi:hypothetical protein
VPRTLPPAAVVALLAGTACGEPATAETAGPPIDCAAVTYDTFGGPFLATYCRSCHSRTAPDRRGAPQGVDFDSEADAVRQSDAIGRTVLESGTMPVGGGVQDSDVALLERWLVCL